MYHQLVSPIRQWSGFTLLVVIGRLGRLTEWKHIGSVAGLIGLPETAGKSRLPQWGRYLAALDAVGARRLKDEWLALLLERLDQGNVAHRRGLHLARTGHGEMTPDASWRESAARQTRAPVFVLRHQWERPAFSHFTAISQLTVTLGKVSALSGLRTFFNGPSPAN